MNEPSFLSILALNVAGFIAFWCGLSWVVGRLSGWERLARHYRARSEPRTLRRWQSALFGRTRYNNTLRLAVDDQGVYIAQSLVFRPGHPPLRIPWSAILSSSEESSGLRLEIDLNDPDTFATHSVVLAADLFDDYRHLLRR